MSLVSSTLSDLLKRDSTEDRAVAGVLGARAVSDTSRLFIDFCKDFEKDLVDMSINDKLAAFNDFQTRMASITKDQAKIFR